MTPLIAANWKMNGTPGWLSKPSEFDALLPASQRQNIEVLLCPPFPLLGGMLPDCERADILLGAQTCHEKDNGAHTGEVSPALLSQLGVSYVIVGHSERRATGETDNLVRTKSEAVLRHNMTPIICIGENIDQRHAGQAQSVVLRQLAASLPNHGTVVIAYEPIWAIGTGQVATVDDINTMHRAIRAEIGGMTRILYGGSVKPGNAVEILAIGDVNGALIGGASLEMESLAHIARAAL